MFHWPNLGNPGIRLDMDSSLQITSSGPRMDRLTTVVGKLQDAANTLEGGPSAGSFLQVDGASMAMVDAGSQISHKAACRNSSVDVCHPLELQDTCICLTLEDDPPSRHDIPQRCQEYCYNMFNMY